MPRWLHSVLFALTTAVLGLALLVSGLMHEREFGLYWLFKMRGPAEALADVAIVAIDSMSGFDMQMSRLPRDWPRSLHGALVDQLSASGARTIVFDMDFSRAREPGDDQAFADAIRNSGRTVLFERLDGRSERIVSKDAESRWVWVETSMPPVEPLAGAARAIAPFPLPKIGQASYQFWTFKPSADDVPTLASVAAQLALLDFHEDWMGMLAAAGVPASHIALASDLGSPGAMREHMQRTRKLFLSDPQLSDRIMSIIHLADLEPRSRQAVTALTRLYGGADERYTNLYGPPGTIRTIRYQDLSIAENLQKAELPEKITPVEHDAEFKEKTVFVGYSDLFSPDQPDRFYTVFTNDKGIDLSGCEIMATAFANLLSDQTVERPPAWISMLAVGLFGLVISQIVFWPSAYFAVPLAILAAGAYVYGAAEAFADHHLWMPLATPIGLQLPFALGAGVLGQYLVERRKKQRVGAAIAQYLPKHLAEGIAEGTVAATNIDQVVHGVCLATDMSGFSRISESKTPGELAEFMNAYFEEVAGALKRCEVDVTEFHADTIMCAWIGKPGERAFRRKALRAGLGVVRAIEEFETDSDAVLRARIGLQDGPFYLGHTGGGGRLAYSILGNPANSASRLEGLNKKLRTRVLAAAGVVDGLDEFIFRPLGEFLVVGKSESVDVVEVIGFRSEPIAGAEELLSGFADGLQKFKAERWEEALAAFRQVAARFPNDGPTRFFRKLCKIYVTQGVPQNDPTRPAMTSK
jgi:adenylate cyclase